MPIDSPRAVNDERLDVPLPAACFRCGGDLRETRVATQIQEDLPVVRPHVRRFDVHVGACLRATRCQAPEVPVLGTQSALGVSCGRVNFRARLAGR